MRQFILGANVAYPASSVTDLNAVAQGAIGFFYNDNGQPKVTATGKEIVDKAMLVLGRTLANGGPVVLPINKYHFTYEKGVYQAATTFAASIIITAPTKVGDYTIIVAKKGLKFNERNKWTANVHVTDTTMTAAALAQALADRINANGLNAGVKATVSTATLTVTALETGKDYELIPADLLTGKDVTYTTRGIPAYGDAAYVRDLAEKAAADAGFEYTYQEANALMYPNYPLDPLKGTQATDTGFTIFTLRFAEPREVKTRDEVVHQIVQVAFPTGAAAITTFETVCKAIEAAAVVEAAAVAEVPGA